MRKLVILNSNRLLLAGIVLAPALILALAFQNCGNLQNPNSDTQKSLDSLRGNVSGNGGGYFGNDPLPTPPDAPPDTDGTGPGGTGTPPELTPPYDIYRAQNKTTLDYLLSQSSAEGPELGYTSQGVAFQLFADAGRALYRCKMNPPLNDHFISYLSNCEGQQFESMLGYAGSVPSDGVPHALHRCYVNSHHLATVNEAECASSDTNTHVLLGYVP